MLDRRDFVKGAALSGGIVFSAGCSGSNTDQSSGEMVEPIIGLHWSDYNYVESMWSQYKKDLEKVGFEVQLESRPLNQGFGAVVNREEWFDAPLIPWGGSPTRMDPNWFIYNLHHSSQAKQGGFNFTGLKNDDLDAIIEEQARTFDRDKRKELLKQAQRIILDEHVDVVAYFPQQINAFDSTKWENVQPLTGAGMTVFSFWPFITAEPKTSDATMVVGVLVGLESLNHMTNVGAYPDGYLKLIYDTLFKFNPDAELTTWLAEDYSIENQTSVNITIKTGQKWHDGEDLTVDDVVFSFEMPKENELPGYGKGLDIIDSVEAIDDQTVQFSLSEPYSPFLGRTLTYGTIIPKHIWEDVDPKNFENEDAIGSGPYQLENWEGEQRYILDAYEDHFRPPGADRLVFQTVGGMSSLISGLQNKSLNFSAAAINYTQLNTVEGMDHIEVVTTETFGPWLFNLRIDQPPFDDIAVRKAVHHALDREVLTELQGGLPTEGQGTVLPPGMFGSAHGELDAAKYEYDIEKAKQILEDAGYTWNDDGRLMYPTE